MMLVSVDRVTVVWCGGVTVPELLIIEATKIRIEA